MTLEPGARLGTYEIFSMLGVGGMGEVYRARDTKLNRDVAIKILPDFFASDPDRLARFQREAQVLASINHPNICSLYHIGDAPSRTRDISNPQSPIANPDSIQFLVMELVEGPTLADVLAGAGAGPRALPIKDALPIATQIADALEAAHEHGIVHRDLKPANIKLKVRGAPPPRTEAGHLERRLSVADVTDCVVKVLDFGLAKLTRAPDSGLQAAGLSQAPTMTTPAMLSGVGVILGTAAYMSPEQARGQDVDKRTDIWAFGCVLYEMLTGRRPFNGEGVSDVLARILEREPDFGLLPAATPGPIRRLLRRCLEKDRRNRLPDIAAARLELQDAQATRIEQTPPIEATGRRPRRRAALATGAGVIGGALGVLIVAAVALNLIRRPLAQPGAVTRFTISLSPGDSFSSSGRHVVALSPDGRSIAYTANNRIYVRPLERLESVPLRGTEAGGSSGRNPFFSPDGEWVGFWQDGHLKKVSARTGETVVLCAADSPLGASWTDNTIVFGQGAGGVHRVSAAGGTPEVLVPVQLGQSAHGPQMLPGGRAVLFTLGIEESWDDAQVVAQSLDTGTPHVLIEGAKDARYLETGHLVYAKGGTIFAVPFDSASLKITGSAVPMVEGLMESTVGNTGAVQFSVSSSGTLVFVPAESRERRTLVWVNREGREEQLTADPRPYSTARISPDGSRLVLNVQEDGNELWMWHFQRAVLTRLTFQPGDDRFAVWTPDGRYVVFNYPSEGQSNLFRQAVDGGGSMEQLTDGPNRPFPYAITADGALLVIGEERRGSGVPRWALRILSLRDRSSRPLLPDATRAWNADLSPDDRWIAFQSDRSGRDEVYVRPFPDAGRGEWQVSNSGGSNPRWTRGGRELVYQALDGTMMAVAVRAGSEFVAENPMSLFRGTYHYGLPRARGFDVTPDGQRFLMIKRSTIASQPPRMIVVENWAEELKQRFSQ